MMSMTGSSPPVAANRGPALDQPVALTADMQRSFDVQAKAQEKAERTEEILSTNAMTARTELNFSVLDLDRDGALSVLEMIQMRPSLPPGPGSAGVDFAQASAEQGQWESLAALLPGDNPVGRFLAAMRAVRGY